MRKDTHRILWDIMSLERTVSLRRRSTNYTCYQRSHLLRCVYREREENRMTKNRFNSYMSTRHVVRATGRCRGTRSARSKEQSSKINFSPAINSRGGNGGQFEILQENLPRSSRYKVYRRTSARIFPIQRLRAWCTNV